MASAPLNTLLLDTVAWDLVLDSFGNIAMATPPYATAQDVASAVRLFLGELYYDTTQGIPYPGQIVGQLPPASVLIQLIQNAALTVPGVVAATFTVTTFTNRTVAGQIDFTLSDGTIGVVNV